MNHKPSLSLFFLAAVIALPGCKDPAARSPVTDAAPAPAAATASPVGTPTAVDPDLVSRLSNAVYPIETTASGKAALKNGAYSEPVADSSGQNTVRLGPQIAYGDLDDTGTQDAAVTLIADSGGSGTATYLSAALDQAGSLQPVPSVFIGDRIIVQSLEIKDRKILLRWLDRSQTDPMSAPPSLETTRSYAVREGKLVSTD